jgi:2-C-methyl-D-erythritol 4-phosphate cytidylyltransferase
VTPALVEECLDVLESEGCDGAIAAAPLADTIKEAEGEVVVRTLDRSRLWAVQTPQVFRRQALHEALTRAPGGLDAATDDASLVEAAGGTVRLVPAPRWNLKVTTREDLALADLLLRAR